MKIIEYILQHQIGKEWTDAALGASDLKTAVDLGLQIRQNSPKTKQRIVKRTTIVTDEALITEI